MGKHLLDGAFEVSRESLAMSMRGQLSS